jgi:hypothetical protein
MASGLISPDLLAQYNQYDTDYGNDLAGYEATEKSGLRDLGFQLNGDTLQMDPTAFYGQYQQTLRGLADSLASARSANIGRGIGRRGLAAARERLLRNMNEGDRSALLNRGQDVIGTYNQNKLGAIGRRDTGQLGIYGKAADEWARNAPDDPGPPAGDGPSAAVGVGDAASGYIAPGGQPITYNPGYTGPHEELPDWVTPQQMPSYFTPPTTLDPQLIKKKGTVL